MTSWDYGVHFTHCCVYSCKYGDVDCPVATGVTAPQFPCEDCTCARMNPGAIEDAQKWWEKLTAEQKAEIYLERKGAS
jgi:hypothetical protein